MKATAQGLLLRLYLYAEQLEVSGLTSWDGKKWYFNDRVWRSGDDDFGMKKQVRDFLGLRPIKYRGDKPPSQLSVDDLRH